MRINADMGEGLDNDAALMPYLDLANIACAAHAGDLDTMRRCIVLAQEHRVQIGAHISFADKEHFGRREISMPAAALLELCCQQIEVLAGECTAVGARLVHVKPHGALYTVMMRNNQVLDTIMQAIVETAPSLELLVMAQTDNAACQKMAAERGITLVYEAFVDRAYDDNGVLVGRAVSGACHQDIRMITQQAHDLIHLKSVHTLGGKRIALEADTLCIHGDSPLALESAMSLRALLPKC